MSSPAPPGSRSRSSTALRRRRPSSPPIPSWTSRCSARHRCRRSSCRRPSAAVPMWGRGWSQSATRSAWPTAYPPVWSPASTGPRRPPTAPTPGSSSSTRRSTPEARAARCSTDGAWSSASSSRSPTRHTRTPSPASGSRCPSAPRSAAETAPGLGRDLRYDRRATRRGQMSPANSTNPLESVLFEVKRSIVGQDVLLERMAVALLSGGHLLVEGVPGLAKTLAVKSLAAAVGGQFQRIQFTPDLVPADLTGTRVYHQHTGEFETQLGPVFANLLLADEINRAPAKVQSALLEVMQEHQVTIGRETFPVPEPFLVMATQNPIESEGTYPLPEAQVDRFMMKVVVDYPRSTEEHAIVDRALRPAEPIRAMLDPADLIGMQERAREIYVDPAVVDYAVRLVTATRVPLSAGLGDLKRYISYGASPRASIALVTGARSLAFLHGRDYVLPDDVGELALDVLRHRIVLSYEALADDITADTIITKVLDAVAAPEVVLSGR